MDGKSSQHPRPRRCFLISIKTFLSYAAVSIVSFHAGCLLSVSSSECPPCNALSKTTPSSPSTSSSILSSSFVRLGDPQRQQRQASLSIQGNSSSSYNDEDNDFNLHKRSKRCNYSAAVAAAVAAAAAKQSSSSKQMTSSSCSSSSISAPPLLPPSVHKLFVGTARVKRDAFVRAFDLGVPFIPTSVGNEEVLVFYSDSSSLPDGVSTQNTKDAKDSTIAATTTTTTTISPEEATKKCVSMDMILVDPDETSHCMVIVGQSRSPLIHKWVRVNDKKSDSSNKNKNNNNNNSSAASLRQQELEPPLQIVGRTHRPDNYFLDYPIKQKIQESYDFLINYLKHMDETLKKLKPIAQACVQGKNNNVVIAMICNHGQSELFINFVCSARAKGLDTSQILLFVADVEMKELAEGMGIRVFYDDKVFGTLPKTAAKQFGDESFMALMLAKVYCLHLINKLGYDILFQDVDIVWNKHPLDYFALPTAGNFDMYFHDDGGRSRGNEPYHANGGFFMIRNNKRTAYFLSNLIRKGDFILNQDEQMAMNLLMVDHVSFTGLRVKIFSREDSNFVGGWNYHHQPRAMKKIMQGNVTPYVFHMSWTNHKFEKRQYLEQMGLFFVSDHCVGKTITEIENETKNITESCCVAEPIVTCHYRDRPSKIPCRDSPPINANAPSFW